MSDSSRHSAYLQSYRGTDEFRLAPESYGWNDS